MHGIEFSSASDRDPKDDSSVLPGQLHPGVISTTIAFRPPSLSATRRDLTLTSVDGYGYGTQSYPTAHPEHDTVHVPIGLTQVSEQEEDKTSVHTRRSVKRQDSDFPGTTSLSYNGLEA